MTVQNDFSDSGEMVAAALRGYRSWEFKSMTQVGTGHEWKPKVGLGSVGITTSCWGTKELTAECKRRDTLWGAIGVPREEHTPPYSQCTCGIYGWYDPGFAMTLHTGAILGVVEYSGRILMGSKGFRAEKGKILAITAGTSRRSINQFSKMLSVLSRLTEILTEQKSHSSHLNMQYDKLQSLLDEAAISDSMVVERTLKVIAEQYDVEYYETVEKMVEVYPPQYDTVENIIGKELERYE